MKGRKGSIRIAVVLVAPPGTVGIADRTASVSLHAPPIDQ
uniref:Uncharacterized protein n=1 Tax=Arundo donax TaxID=35708 RepID=A0A0A9BH99_ARUDO